MMYGTKTFLLLVLSISFVQSENTLPDGSSNSHEDSQNNTKSTPNASLLTSRMDEAYFLRRIMDLYGDGVTISSDQLQTLMSALKSGSAPAQSHEDTGKRKRSLDNIVVGDTEGIKASCQNKSHWLTDAECLDQKCLTAEEIFQFHSVSESRTNTSSLLRMSPTLLYTAQNSACVTIEKKSHGPPKVAEVWGYSFLCVTIINLCSLMGMVFLPLMQKKFYKKLLMFMVALAVGTLSGSALLFLIPECFDMSNEENPFFHDYVWKCTTVLGGIYMFFLVERVLKNIMDWRKRMLTKCDSDESSMDTVSASNYYEPLHRHGEDNTHLEGGPISSLKTRSIHRHDSINMTFKVPNSPKVKSLNSNAKLPKVKSLSSNAKLVNNQSKSTIGESESRPSTVAFDLGADQTNTEPIENDLPTFTTEIRPRKSNDDPETSGKPKNRHTSDSSTCSPACQCTERSPVARAEAEAHVNYGMVRSNESAASLSFMRPNISGAQLLEQDPSCVIDDSTPPTPTDSSDSSVEIKSVAWMVIFGDGLHNFIDGLSIGAAFAKNVLAGVSVSLAVVCEELPHELGDFAILLNSGMSMRQALVYNFLSACMCYLGLILGIVLGEMTTGSSWIFAMASGMFLYISLVDMLPEVNHAAEEETKATGHVWGVFFLQNAGLLTGYGIMLILAVFSEKIDLETGY